MTSCDGNPGPGFGHARVSGGVKYVDGILSHLIKMDFRPDINKQKLNA
jgi:hypothetical protein